MNFPFQYPTTFDATNSFFFVPTETQQALQDKNEADNMLETHPLLDYLDKISAKTKFNYLIIMLVVILFFYRLNLHSSIWLGLIIALFVIYYINEKARQKLNTEADELWAVLKGPLLKHTKYFVGDPQMIRFIKDVSDLKVYNVLEFNLMVRTLDLLLKNAYSMRLGITNVKPTMDIFRDLKVASLNQFHSLVYRIPFVGQREKLNFYLESLGKMLNDRENELLKIARIYYNSKPVNIDTSFFDQTLSDPKANDPFNSENYNFYN